MGDAVVTTASRLPFRGVIHAVGPRTGDGNEEEKIARALKSAFLRAHECGSLLVTTNLAFKDWGIVSPNAACMSALIDRLTHHAEILTLTGESYPRREAKATQKARRGKP